MHLSQWPLVRVLIVCFVWLVFAAIVFIGVPYRRAVATMKAEGHGVFALSAPLASLLGPVLLPPLVFLVAWLFFRGAFR